MKTFLPVLAVILVFGTFFISFKMNFEQIKTKEISEISEKIDTPKVAKIHKEDTSKEFVSEGHFIRYAEFKGGNIAFKEFVRNNLQYPKSYNCGIEGTVYVRFIVDIDGSIIKDCVKIAKSLEKSFDEEAIRVVKLMPNWTPATQNGRYVRQRIRVPVKFKIK